MRTRLLPVLLIAVTLAVAACGGSAPLTKAQFDAKLGSACKTANAAFAKAATNKAKAAAIADFLTAAKGISAPSKLQTLYSRYLAVIAQEQKLQAQGNSNALFAIASKQARPLAQQMGATGCLTG